MNFLLQSKLRCLVLEHCGFTVFIKFFSTLTQCLSHGRYREKTCCELTLHSGVEAKILVVPYYISRRRSGTNEVVNQTMNYLAVRILHWLDSDARS